MGPNDGPPFTRDSCVRLNDGNLMPVMAFGTLKPDVFPALNTVTINTPDQIDTNDVEEATKTALELGFRHIDSALVYIIEKGVGKAIKDVLSKGTIKREDIFYTTKIWNTFHRPERVRKCLERSLELTQLSYVDLCIVHMPMAFKSGDELFALDENGKTVYEEADFLKNWEAMEKLKDEGLAKSIGVSNYNIEQLNLILNKPDLKYRPAAIQLESHLHLPEKELIDFCKKNGIFVIAYGPLGSSNGIGWIDESLPRLLDDPTLKEMAKKYGKTPAQVAIRYNLDRGCATLVRSFNPKHTKENLEACDFQLSPEDVKTLDELQPEYRYWKFKLWTDCPTYPFK